MTMNSNESCHMNRQSCHMNDSYEHDYEWLIWTWLWMTHVNMRDMIIWMCDMIHCYVHRVSSLVHVAHSNESIYMYTHTQPWIRSYESLIWMCDMIHCYVHHDLTPVHIAYGYESMHTYIYIYTWYDSWAICVIAMCTMPRVTFTLYMWMSYEAHVNESCRTWRTSHVTMCVIAMCTMTRVMLRWRMSHMRHITHGNESCRTWVMLHMQMSYEAQVNTSCRTWRTSHVTMCIIAMCTKTRILRHMSHMRHIIRGKEACST